MTEVVKWAHPRDAAAEAVVWHMIASVAEEHKKEARAWLANRMKEESVGKYEAVANGQVIGSVTRSKPGQKTDVVDWPAFIEYIAAHHPQLLKVEYLVKESFLKRLNEVEGKWIDTEYGEAVPGIGTVMTTATVRVNPDNEQRDVVRGLLAHGLVRLEGLRTPPALEQTA